jgi:hypothetical protein
LQDQARGLRTTFSGLPVGPSPGDPRATTDNRASVNAAQSDPPGRFRAMIMIVPRHEVGLYEYLCRSLAATPEIEVVLDRRRGEPRLEGTVERRDGRNGERRILMCALVQRAESQRATAPAMPAEPAAAPEPAKAGRRRTLLWPALRIDQL